MAFTIVKDGNIALVYNTHLQNNKTQIYIERNRKRKVYNDYMHTRNFPRNLLTQMAFTNLLGYITTSDKYVKMIGVCVT